MSRRQSSAIEHLFGLLFSAGAFLVAAAIYIRRTYKALLEEREAERQQGSDKP